MQYVHVVYISSKWIAPTDNMWPKLHDEYAGHQWLKGLLHAIAIVDREIFMLKIIKIRGVKFSWFVRSAKKFLTVDSYIMNERLERSLHLICYLVLGEPAIAGCNAVAVRSSRQSDVYLGRYGRVSTLICCLLSCNGFYLHVKFCSWSQP